MYIVINGGGKIAEYLATKMLENGHNVAIIEKREAVADHLAEVLPKTALVINGDGCDSSFQDDAGVANADIFVATTGDDDDNLVSCEIAQIVFKIPRAIARVNNPKNLRIFKASNIEAVSSTTIISRIIEEEAFAGNMRMLASLREGGIEMIELELPPAGDFITAEGREARDFVVPQASLLVAVQRDDELESIQGNTLLYPGDTIVALVKSGAEAALKKSLHAM